MLRDEATTTGRERGWNILVSFTVFRTYGMLIVWPMLVALRAVSDDIKEIKRRCLHT